MGLTVASLVRLYSVAELPVLREKGTDRSKMQLVPLQNDYIPDELMDTLTSTIDPPNKLGSSKRSKTPPKKVKV